MSEELNKVWKELSEIKATLNDYMKRKEEESGWHPPHGYNLFIEVCREHLNQSMTSCAEKWNRLSEVEQIYWKLTADVPKPTDPIEWDEYREIYKRLGVDLSATIQIFQDQVEKIISSQEYLSEAEENLTEQKINAVPFDISNWANNRLKEIQNLS